MARSADALEIPDDILLRVAVVWVVLFALWWILKDSKRDGDDERSIHEDGLERIAQEYRAAAEEFAAATSAASSLSQRRQGHLDAEDTDGLPPQSDVDDVDHNTEDDPRCAAGAAASAAGHASSEIFGARPKAD